ncbi:MAG: class I SAM-dependent methyltransferase [Cyclobacteriaceae bacterium]
MSKVRDINNYFGDTDLFLLDLILKGKIPEKATVLDAGCGEGRNAIFFIREGYDYLGIDSDQSKIQLAQYMANNISTSKARFEVGDIGNLQELGLFDVVICSRVLHFVNTDEGFHQMWRNLSDRLAPNGILYVSMDSMIDNNLGLASGNGKYEFPDGAVRFAITNKLYNEIKKGFEPVEPLKTLVQNETRAQSFFALRKV